MYLTSSSCTFSYTINNIIIISDEVHEMVQKKLNTLSNILHIIIINIFLDQILVYNFDYMNYQYSTKIWSQHNGMTLVYYETRLRVFKGYI